MKTINSEDIVKIEIPDLMDSGRNRYIKIYYKNGEDEKYAATIRSNMYGINPELEVISATRIYEVPKH